VKCKVSALSPSSAVTSGNGKSFDTGFYGRALLNALIKTCDLVDQSEGGNYAFSFVDIGGTFTHTVYGAYEFNFDAFTSGNFPFQKMELVDQIGSSKNREGL
jgi:hypothetical protein